MRGVLSGSMLLMVTLIAAPAWSDSRQNGAERRGSEASVVFTAHDYGSTGPDQIPAGLHPKRNVRDALLVGNPT
jgi:hypothetical protein